MQQGGKFVRSRPGLRLSEVAPGPRLSYIEVHNDDIVPIDLDGYEIETATGIHSLTGLAASLPADGYFVLIQGSGYEVGVSSDPAVAAIVIATPTCGQVSDTVLLRAPGNVVVDAVSYGNSVDRSSRYLDAVAAGELLDGEFVSVADEFVELTLGRNIQSLDTDRTSDWAAGGGANALTGSPFGRNNSLPDGEEVWVPFFQSFVSSAVSQPYFEVDVLTGSSTGYSSQGATHSSSVQTMVFRGDILGPADVTLTGIVSNALSKKPGNAYEMRSSGVMTSPSGQSLDVDIRREISGSIDNLSISAAFTNGGVTYPYSLEVTRSYSGLRGEFDHSINRTITGWSGIPKTTVCSQHVTWNLDALGRLASTDSSASYTRPYPLSDGSASEIGSTPDPVLTMETGFLDMTTLMTSAGPVSTWTRYEQHFANGNATIIGSGITSATFVDQTGGVTAVESSVSGPLGGSGQFFNLDLHSRAEATAGGKLTHVTLDGSLGGLSLGPLGDYTFDPPAPLFGGFWEGLTSVVTATAKAIGVVTMYAIGAIGCVATTVAGSAVAGGVTVATLGAATPGALLAAGAGVTACLGLSAA